MAGIVNIPARTRDRPTAIQGLQAIHDPGKIFDHGQITSGQFPQHAYAALAVIDGLEIIEAQPIGEFAGINLVTLVAMFEQRVLARVAHHQLGHMRLEQIVQPCGPGPLFEGHRQGSTQAAQELENGGRFCFQNGFHD